MSINKKKFRPRYMIATKAMHGTDDVSRSVPGLCRIYNCDKENYIGNWIEGFRLSGVRFPKKTTRELTEEEKDIYNGMLVEIGGCSFLVETKKNLIPKKSIKVVTKNSIYVFGEMDGGGARTIDYNKGLLDFKKCVITFLVKGKSMQFYQDDGSGMIWITSEVMSIE